MIVQADSDTIYPVKLAAEFGKLMNCLSVTLKRYGAIAGSITRLADSGDAIVHGRYYGGLD